MDLLFLGVLFLLFVVWLSWLVTYVFGQKRQYQSTQLKAEMLQKDNAVLLPLKIQALERLLLLMERIRPEALVHRCSPDQAAASMQLSMLAQLRSEFEHNLAQQLYVHPSTWASVLQARDLVAGAIQQAGGMSSVDGPGIQFARQLLQQGQNANLAIDQAVAALKRELESSRYV